MKILLLTDFYGEGLQYQENLMVKYYAKLGHEVVVATSTFQNVFDYYSNKLDGQAGAVQVQGDGFRLHRLRYSLNLFNRFRFLEGFKRLLQRERPDLIVLHNIMPDLVHVAGYCRKNRGVGLVLSYHADASNSARNWLSRWILHGVLRRAVLKFGYDCIDRMYPVVPAGADFLHEVYRIPREDMEILPLGADTDIISEIRDKKGKPALRASLGIPDDAFVVFTGGKLNKTKRTELLLQAVQTIDDPRLHLVVCGAADSNDAEYEAVLAQAKSSDTRIHLLGWQTQRSIYECMCLSDIAVFPASQSILWQQAIASGLPLIVGDSGGQDVSYLNDGNIIVMKGSDISVETIRREITRLAQAGEEVSRMKNAALKVAGESLDWNVLAARTAGLGR